MSGEREDVAVSRLLRLVAKHLRAHLDGDEQALGALGEVIDQEEFTAEDLHLAVVVLRNLGSDPHAAAAAALEAAPAETTQRVLSAEEREAMSPEAWGYLLDLRRRGSLDPGQFERVLDLLTGSGVRPVGVDQAREAATLVALEMDDEEGPDLDHGEIDVAH